MSDTRDAAAAFDAPLSAVPRGDDDADTDGDTPAELDCERAVEAIETRDADALVAVAAVPEAVAAAAKAVTEVGARGGRAAAADSPPPSLSMRNFSARRNA